MRNSLLAVIFSLLYWSRGISADDDIKRGTFRFMAFIYYQDESVVDATSARFMQGAVLVRENFLISSSLISSISEDPLSKTLLARLGAIRIDANFTFNEDEDEQEQEIVQISRPLSVNRTSWWASDISLLKTLLPFKMTSAVHVTKLSVKQDYSDKICNVIVYKKKKSVPDGPRFLMPVTVEMLPSTTGNCGEQFDERTMACSVDPQGASNEDRSPDNFCQGNSGGPLICDNDVMALQTYIEGNCNPPHLYQLLAPWKKFLDCGTKDYCGNEDKCPNVCSVTLKDSPPTNITTKAKTREMITIAATESNEPTKAKTRDEPTETFDSEATEQRSTESQANSVETKAETESTTTSEVRIESSSVPVNQSNETSWPARRQNDKNEEVKKDSREIEIQAQQRRVGTHRQHTDSSARTTIVLHGLIYNCLFASICLL